MEDGAFIRAIVTNPDDDTTRLVYADWLDERGDPRGALLRAELEWARPWRDGNCPPDPKALRKQAKKIDPLWALRVARPPLGVCCALLVTPQSEDGGAGGAGEADEVPEFDFPIPLDFVALMANYAGRDGAPFTIRWPAAWGELWEPGTAVRFDPGFIFDWDIFAEAFDEFDEDEPDVAWVAGCENASSRDGTLSLALGGRKAGRVFVGSGMYVGLEGLVEVAPSLSAFLALVRPAE
jgi:uncharacterized protein (TIGR02996 family)